MRRMLSLYCFTCNNAAEKLLDANTRKIRCSCGGTLHKVIAAPRFNQNSSHGQVNTAGDKAFDKAGKKQPPIRSYPEEADITDEE